MTIYGDEGRTYSDVLEEARVRRMESAASDMLAALKAVVAGDPEARWFAMEAIAKAEGRTP